MLTDPASNIQVIELLPMANYPAGTLSPSYSDPTFTRAFDSRPFMTALIVVVAEVATGDASAVLTLQASAEDTDRGVFNDFADLTTTTGSTAAFSAITTSNDNAVYYATVDMKKAQNALGAELVVTATGGNRARIGAYAVCFPYDTSNVTITKEFAV
jgi:hypothetical protein